MKSKWSFGLSVFVLATLAFLALPSLTAGKEKKAMGKELRWHGTLVNKSTDGSTLTVSKGGVQKAIHITSETKWTKTQKGKVVEADPNDVKEGSDIICLGKANDKGEFEATRIDLRLPK